MKKIGILIAMAFCLSLVSFTVFAAEKATPAPKTAQTEAKKESMVFTTKTGKKYHASQTCSTLKQSKNIQQISMTDASKKKMEPCKVCYPPKK